MPSRDDPSTPGNHLVSSPTTPDGANGFSSGTMRMNFTNAPGYVSFLGTVNDAAAYNPSGTGEGFFYTVRAYDLAGQPISTSSITSTLNSRYTSTSGVLFRRDFITVSNSRGISRVEVLQKDIAVLFDNLSLSTYAPIP